MDPRARFGQLIALPDQEIPLAEAALCIAAEARPRLDVDHCLEEIDAVAGRVHPHVAIASSVPERVEVLNHALFVDEGFAGNLDDYGNPLNSFLDAVLERRTGIPITLSLVYIEVAKRIGLDARGVGFPGHFLAKVKTGGSEIIVDPFYGRTMSLDDCAQRLHQVVGDRVRFDPAMLVSAGHAEILQRILSNLKLLYISAHDYESALGCCERILMLVPDAPTELRDRGLVLRELDCHAVALADLERFLELAPDDTSVPAVRPLLEELRAAQPRVH